MMPMPFLSALGLDSCRTGRRKYAVPEKLEIERFQVGIEVVQFELINNFLGIG